MNERDAAAYLAAMIDGEGHVSSKSKSIRISNTEFELIEAIIESCVALDLHYAVNGPKSIRSGKSVWEVNISSRSTLERVRDLVPIRSSRKKSALVDAIGSFKYKARPPREWVEQKYVFEGLSLREVAMAWGLKSNCKSCAHGWLKFYGIPARTSETRKMVVPSGE